MTYVRLKDYTFTNLREFNADGWLNFRYTLIRIIAWTSAGKLQEADVEDLAQDLLLRLRKILGRSSPHSKREMAPLHAYVFRAVRRLLIDYSRKTARSHVLLADDYEIILENHQKYEGDLDWIRDAFHQLRQSDRDQLEHDIFDAETTVKSANGSKKIANRNYKRSFDARKRFRAVLQRSRADLEIHVRRGDLVQENYQNAA